MPRYNKARSFISDSSGDNEYDRIESDLLKYKRDYRVFQEQKRSLKTKADARLMAQQAEIAQLMKEKQRYLLELSIADSDQNAKHDQNTLSRMQTNLQNKASIIKQIEDQKMAQETLNKDCLIWSKKLHEQRIKMGGAEKTSNFHKVVARKIEVSEGNLHRENSKFNNILSDNARLRGKIETLQHEKEKFKTKFGVLNQKFLDNKSNISTVIEQSTSAYESMLEARSKIKIQQEKSQKELEQFVNEITTEEKKIDHEKRQQEFMSTKGLERDDSERINRERDQARLASEQRSNLKYNLESSWEKITNICANEMGVDSENVTVDTAIRKFEESEEANFALFNFVSDQNNEIERMNEELERIQSEQDNNKNMLQQVEEKHDEDFDELTNIRLDLEASEQMAQEKILAETKNLKVISDGVLELFKNLECSEQDLGIALKSEMLDEYITTYLAVIEAKINTLLSAKIYLRAQEGANEEIDGREFTAADAIREVLGKIEKPKAKDFPVANLFETQFNQVHERNNPLANSVKTDNGLTSDGLEDDDGPSENRGARIEQTTESKIMQIADTGHILSYEQLRDKVKNDLKSRKTSVLLKNQKRSSLIKTEIMDDSVGNVRSSVIVE